MRDNRKANFSAPRLFQALLSLFIALSINHTAFSEISQRTIVYNSKLSTNDTRDRYPLELLKLALRKSGVFFHLVQSPRFLVQKRALEQLALGIDLDIVWTMTSKQREAELIPIRFPIYKGLVGLRLLLIKRSDAASFSSIHTLRELNNKKAGQGHNWPDKKILEDNGLTVYGVVNYTSLFQMLAAGRLDYVPRSILEIWSEIEQYRSLDLVAEPTLALCYPAATYFFFNSKNSVLADQIEAGLLLAKNDGSFEKLFQSFHKTLLERSEIEKRQVFSLENTIMPSSLPHSEFCNERIIMD